MQQNKWAWANTKRNKLKVEKMTKQLQQSRQWNISSDPWPTEAPVDVCMTNDWYAYIFDKLSADSHSNWKVNVRCKIMCGAFTAPKWVPVVGHGSNGQTTLTRTHTTSSQTLPLPLHLVLRSSRILYTVSRRGGHLCRKSCSISSHFIPFTAVHWTAMDH